MLLASEPSCLAVSMMINKFTNKESGIQDVCASVSIATRNKCILWLGSKHLSLQQVYNDHSQHTSSSRTFGPVTSCLLWAFICIAFSIHPLLSVLSANYVVHKSHIKKVVFLLPGEKWKTCLISFSFCPKTIRHVMIWIGNI